MKYDGMARYKRKKERVREREKEAKNVNGPLPGGEERSGPTQL